MDNKITRARFSNLMSYEWIMMIVILVVGIIVFELLFAFFGVRLTTGQEFKYYYDLNVDNSLESGLLDVLFVENKTFSYDVMLIGGEAINEETNLLVTRLKGQEGDVVITNSVPQGEKGEVRAKSLVDTVDVPVYDLNQLLEDGRNYLKTFLKDEFLTLSPAEQTEMVKEKENLSTDKIDEAFLVRMVKDNRFRTEAQKEEGKKYERERIFNLVKEFNDFERLLEVGDEYGLLYRYTKYEQVKDLVSEQKDKEMYESLYQAEVERGKANAVYGINVEKLSGGKHSPSEFFKVSGGKDASSVVIMAFNFLSYQPELQFETVNFINSIVRSCSNIYQVKN